VKKTSNKREKRKAEKKNNFDKLRNDEFCNIYVLQLVTGMNGVRKM
jgi:hypothetical protein